MNKWIFFVARRFSQVDRKGSSKATSILATLGICFGVMTLIVVMSVMNGFQMSFIDSIIEVSSYHIQVSGVEKNKEKEFLEICDSNSNIKYVTPFYEAQTLLVGKKGKESAALIRAIDPQVYFSDEGFNKELNIFRGSFNLSEKNSILVASYLASELGVKIGDTVNLFVLSGGNDVELLSDERLFTVTGIFSTGYGEINSSYCFINILDAPEYFGIKNQKKWGIKLFNSDKDLKTVYELKKYISGCEINSWRDYNKSFYSTLKIEKNMLLLLVALIFVVVGINIYNGNRRLVFERKNEIAIFSSMGAKPYQVKLIFILRGFFTGFIGAVLGLLLGILISINTDVVFNAAAKVIFFFQYLFTSIFAPDNLGFIAENSTYSIYASIPARMFPKEIAFITLFGILSPLFASWIASRHILKFEIAEVLHE